MTHRISPFALALFSFALACTSGATGARTTLPPEVPAAPACTLSARSCAVIAELQGTVTITAYLSDELHEMFVSARATVEAYGASSGGRILVRVVVPETAEQRAEAEAAGMTVVEFQRIENDEVVSASGYRGVVIAYGQAQRALPNVGQGIEYDITVALEAIALPPTPIGVLTGHGTPSLDTLHRIASSYRFVDVSATSPIDPSLPAVLVIDTVTPLSDTELRNLHAYVRGGGSLGVLGGGIHADIEGGPSLTATPTGSRLNELLSDWGIAIGANVVADAQCGRVPMQQLGQAIPVPYPPAPIVTIERSEDTAPIFACEGSTPLFFVSAITTSAGFDGVVLMRSSRANSWLLEGPPIDLHIRMPTEWQASMTSSRAGPFTLAVAVEDDASRLLVSGTATGVLDAFLPTPGTDAELADTMQYWLDALDWLAHHEDRVALRATDCE